MTNDWQAAPGSPSSYIVKRILRLDIPVGNYPNVSCVLLNRITCFYSNHDPSDLLNIKVIIITKFLVY